MNTKNKAFIIVSLAMLVMCGLWFASAISLGYFKKETSSQSWNYAVQNGTVLTIDNKLGKLNIESYDGSEILIDVLKITYFGREELDKVDIDISPGVDFSIRTDYDETITWVSVEMDIQIPREVHVKKVETDWGRIDIEGTSGDIHIETQVGAIYVSDHEGDLDLKTGHGKVRISDVTGNVTSICDSGSIQISGVDGIVKAVTDNGKVDIFDVLDIREVRTSNGDINIRVINASVTDTFLKTSNGDIEMHIPLDSDLNVEMSTSNGDLDFHNLMISRSNFGDNKIKGTIGNGGTLLEIKTSNGDVDLYGYQVHSIKTKGGM